MTDSIFTYKRDDLTVTIERIFDAPREVVWKTITDPELIPQWWGPEKYPTRVEKMDVREGGSWRFISVDDQGNEMPFSGDYLVVDPPVRLTQTFNFEPIGPGHESTETSILEETAGGKTRMTVTAVYGSLADFDGMLASGMESGARETWQRLADLLATVKV